MSTFWKSLVRRIVNGNPIDASISNGPVDDLTDRTEWLKRRFESLQTNSGKLIVSGAPVESSVQAGNWVYYDPDLEVYRAGIAAMELTGSSMPRPARTAFISGVVTAKTGPTVADVMLFGEGTIGADDVIQIPSVTYMLEEGEDFVPGEYYLSAVTPGKMTATPAGAPVVHLGTFSESLAQISIHTRLMQDGHVHNRFALRNRPSSNSGAWAVIDNAGTDIGFVDYSDDVAHTDVIQISVQITPGMTWDGVRRRIRVHRAASGSGLLIKSSTLSWLGVETEESEIEVTKPEYGDLLDLVAGDDEARIGVSVYFYRPDYFVTGASVYADGFSTDFAASVPQSKGWVIDVPDGLSGWTNCCPEVGSQVPAGAALRYVTEGQYDLSSLLPTSPIDSPTLNIGGDLMTGNWVRTFSDIYWTDTVAETGGAWELPWPEALDVDDPSTFSAAFLSFETSPYGDSDPVVRSIFSRSDILRFVKHGTETEASTGALEVVLDYSLILDRTETPADNECLAGVSENGDKFLVGPRVSEIVPGPNLLVRRVASDGSLSESGTQSGKVQIDLASTTSEGSSPSFSLFNAKESERNGVSYIEFVQPSQAATAAVARISVPDLEVGEEQYLTLEFKTQWIGQKPGTGDVTLAVMKAEVRIVRPGVNLAGSLSAPAEVHALGISVPLDYSAFEVMDELSIETFNVEDMILPGDQIFLRISRETNTTPFNVGPAAALAENLLDPDDYPGRVGLVSAKWRIFAQ